MTNSADNACHNGASLPPKDQIKKVSFSDTFSKVWNDKTYHDLTLVGTDGKEVTVNRFALGARNAVFQKMLYGGFQEANKKKLNVDYTGEVTQAVVEYLHKDSACLLMTNNKSPPETPDLEMKWERSKFLLSADEDMKKARLESLVSLVAASVFFNIPALSYDAIGFIAKIVKETPKLSASVLEICVGPIGLSLPKEVKEAALPHLLRICAQSCNYDQNPGFVEDLSPAVIEEIMKCDDSDIYEFDHFQIIQRWANGKGHKETTEQQMHLDRKSFAKSMVEKHIHLENIKPKKLNLVVASSGLVSDDQLFEAYKCQALAATASTIGLSNTRKSNVTRWVNTKSFEFQAGYNDYRTDYLNVHPITSGKYQWSIAFVECDDVAIGIAVERERHNGNESYCGSNITSWGYHSRGVALHDQEPLKKKPEIPGFGKGDFVTLTLNLLDRKRNGSLSASVCGGDEFILFENLNRTVKYGDRQGFVPAASICVAKTGSCIQMVDFQKCHPEKGKQTEISTDTTSSGLVADDYGRVVGRVIRWVHARSSEYIDAGEWHDGHKIFSSDFLDINPISSGKHQWKIEIHNCEGVILGIALHSDCVGEGFETRGLGETSQSWGWVDDGSTHYDNEDLFMVQPDIPCFHTASTVTLTLDMLDQERNGALVASIDEGDEFVVFKNLLSHIADDPENGFVPAASIHIEDDDVGGHIQLTEYRELS